MDYLKSFYNNYNEEERLLLQHGRVEYYLATCERQDTVGASNHTLDILRKK